MQTHETFIAQVAALVRARLNNDDVRALAHIKLAYGTGPSGARGVTYYKAWQNGETEPAPFVELCAFGESDWIQLAGTTVHELGHVLAGFTAGHGKGWKEATQRCGLQRPKAAGQSYTLALFAPDLREAIYNLEKPADGAPNRKAPSLIGLGLKPKPCGAGIGTRGGKSKGPGSGSRLIKVACTECGYPVRVTRKWLDQAGAPLCPQHNGPMLIPS